ncbi:MAG: PA14 domain-containing protein, partial [Saprospiraceae bacterium]
FIVNSDDGCRLWVDGKLLLDAWYPKEEYDLASSVIWLEGGQRYDIKLEYYEIGGLAAARLYWATPSMEKNIIPKTQLYPRLPTYTGGVKASLDFLVQPNPARGDALTLRVRATHREQVRIRLVDQTGKVLVEQNDVWIEAPDQLIELPIAGLASGCYWVQMEGRSYGGQKVEGVVKM